MLTQPCCPKFVTSGLYPIRASRNATKAGRVVESLLANPQVVDPPKKNTRIGVPLGFMACGVTRRPELSMLKYRPVNGAPRK